MSVECQMIRHRLVSSIKVTGIPDRFASTFLIEMDWDAPAAQKTLEGAEEADVLQNSSCRIAMLMPGGDEQVMKSYMGSVRKSAIYEKKLREGKPISIRMEDLTLKVVLSSSSQLSFRD